MTPDLDTPVVQLLLASLFAWLVWVVLWAHEHRSAVARFRRTLARLGRSLVGAEDDHAARVGRRLHRPVSREQRRRARRHADALTPDEVVALARWIDLGTLDLDGQLALDRALDKIDAAATDVLNADRAGRRR